MLCHDIKDKYQGNAFNTLLDSRGEKTPFSLSYIVLTNSIFSQPNKKPKMQEPMWIKKKGVFVCQFVCLRYIKDAGV